MSNLGDIVLLDFPYTNRTGSKARPGLIIGLNQKNNFGDINIAYISTEIDSYIYDDSAVKIMPADLAEGTLKRESVVRVDKVITVQGKICRKVARLNAKKLDEVLRQAVAFNVDNFATHKYNAATFVAGNNVIPPSGKVLGAPELKNMVEASLDGWLTTGRFNDAFEKKLGEFLKVKHVLTTTSGSSANLLALAALTSPKLGAKALKRGDEVIAVAAGFPTSVNPILQYGLVPVFVDVELPSYNIDATKIAAAITDKTRAIMLAHTLGNAFDIDTVMHLARKHDLWVIEDCCDALGTTYTPKTDLTDYKGNTIPAGVPRHVGTFGTRRSSGTPPVGPGRGRGVVGLAPGASRTVEVRTHGRVAVGHELAGELLGASSHPGMWWITTTPPAGGSSGGRADRPRWHRHRVP